MNTYNTYDFNSDVGFTSNKCCDIDIDIDTDLIKNTIKDSISDITDDIENTLEATKNEIIEAVNNKNCECECVTKEELKDAVHCINHNTNENFHYANHNIDKHFHCLSHHIDEHLNGVNLKYEFENLNNQIKKLQET